MSKYLLIINFSKKLVSPKKIQRTNIILFNFLVSPSRTNQNQKGFSCQIAQNFICKALIIFLWSCGTANSQQLKKNIFLHRAGIPLPEKIAEHKTSLESWLVNAHNKGIFPSIGVGITHKGKLIYEYYVSSEPTQNYGLGSITKTFTATMIVQASELGLIHLDDPISKYFPDLKIEKEELKSKPITIRNILSHRSGMPDLRYYTSPEWVKQSSIPFNVTAQIYPAGYHYRYSNIGFMILGKLLEKVYGLPLQTIVREQIFNKIGMSNSIAHPGVSGAGGISTNIPDLAKFASMYMRGGISVNDNRVLKEETIASMVESPVYIPFAKVKKYCGLGWRVESEGDDIVTFFHIGGANYIAGWIQFFPRYDIAIMYLSNPPEYTDELMSYLISLQRKMGDIATTIAGASEPLYKIPDDSPKPELFSMYTGNYRNPLTKQNATVTINQNKLFLEIENSSKRYLTPDTINLFGGMGGYGSYEFTFDPITKKVLGVSSYNGFFEKKE